MVKDTLNSIFDNIKERTTNPFLGTLLVVWSIKNWRLIYSLLYFDSRLTLDQRLAKISEHFANQSFILNMIITLVITMAVLIATYLMLGLSRLLTDYYDNVIIPKSAEVTSNGSKVVLKLEHLKLLEEKRNLETRLQDERVAKATLTAERDMSDAKVAELLASRNTLPELEIPPSQGNTEFIRIANKLYKEWGISTTNIALSRISGEAIMSNVDELVRCLAREAIIEPTGKTMSSGTGYRFSTEGKAFLKYWNNNFADMTPDRPS